MIVELAPELEVLKGKKRAVTLYRLLPYVNDSCLFAGVPVGFLYLSTANHYARCDPAL